MFCLSVKEIFSSLHGATVPTGPGPPHYRRSTITLRHTTLLRLLWMSDQPEAENFTRKSTTVTRERLSCLPRVSKPQTEKKQAVSEPRLRPRGN